MHIERSTGKILPFVKSKNDRCSICGKIVGHEEAQTDERGDVVHEPCLVARSSSPAGQKKFRRSRHFGARLSKVSVKITELLSRQDPA
jgi:hypothetical protein